MAEVETELARRLGRGEEVVLATVIRIDGKPPSRPGAKLLLARSAALAGTLGCSEFDAAAVSESESILDGGSPATRSYQHDLGSIEVYLEPYAPAPMLVVMGATPVARHLLGWAPQLGFRTLLMETRAARLAAGSWPASATITDLSELEAALGSELFAIHTDHDSPDLVDALTTVLARGPRLVGLMGSRRHTGHHLEALRAMGMPEEQIQRIQSPVGIDIGALTAPEIALSILAGVVARRRGANPRWMHER